MSWLALALTVLAVVRATRLVVADDLTAGLRRSLVRRYPARNVPLYHPGNGEPQEGTGRLEPSLPVRFVNCPWCVSFWLSLAAVLAVHALGFVDRWQMVVLAWWGVAGGSGLLLEVSAR